MDIFNLLPDEGLSFDDVLLLPAYSEVKRNQVNTSSFLTKKIKLKIPIVSSPMDTVTESKMAKELAQAGGIGIIHRNLTVSDQVNQILWVKRQKPKNQSAALNDKGQLLVGAAVGPGIDLESRVAALAKTDVDVVVIDSGHGMTKKVIDAVLLARSRMPNTEIIAGNIATEAGAKLLIKTGVDALRVGMGPGSICTTRIIAGIGVPQLTAIGRVGKVAKKNNIPVIADGGIRYSGDIVKALAVGASTVMLGGVLAACEESPGEVVKLNGKKYKIYRGMGSIPSMKQGAANRYGQDYKDKKKLIAEGVEGLTPYKGKLADCLFQLIGGLKAGMFYTGAKNILELQKRARFIKITHGSLIESHPHDVLITGSNKNYNYGIKGK